MIPKLHPAIAIVLIIMGVGLVTLPLIYHLLIESQRAYVEAHAERTNHTPHPLGSEILIGYFVFGALMIGLGVFGGRDRG